MRIPTAWIEINVGDWVIVKRHRSPKQVESFGLQRVFDEDNRPSREAIVHLVSETGKRTYAFTSEILGKARD